MLSQNPTIDAKTTEILNNRDRRWKWIIHQLKLRGSSLSAIARENKLTPSSTQIAHKKHYPRVQHLIAKKLDIEAHILFPNRYDENYLPIRESEVKNVA